MATGIDGPAEDELPVPVPTEADESGFTGVVIDDAGVAVAVVVDWLERQTTASTTIEALHWALVVAGHWAASGS